MTGEKALARNTIRTARERSARNVNPKWQAKPQKSEADFENLCHTFFPPSVRSARSLFPLARKYADVIETSLKRIRQRRRRQRQSWGRIEEVNALSLPLSISAAKECDPLFYSFLSHLRSIFCDARPPSLPSRFFFPQQNRPHPSAAFGIESTEREKGGRQKRGDKSAFTRRRDYDFHISNGPLKLCGNNSYVYIYALDVFSLKSEKI